jgi:hypothetical protein
LHSLPTGHSFQSATNTPALYPTHGVAYFVCIGNHRGKLYLGKMAKPGTDAQFRVARLYGFASWAKLKTYVEWMEEIGRLKQAIDANDLDTVKSLMSGNLSLTALRWVMGRTGR